MATPPKPVVPNAAIKFTMKFADGYQAITEAHHLSASGNSDLATVWTTLGKPLMTARAALMGAGVSAISARVSVVGSPRVYFNAPANEISGMVVGPQKLTVTLTPQESAGGITNTEVTGDADVPNVSVLLNVYDVSYGLHARYYLAGLPAVFVAENPASPPQIRVVSWQTAFDNYVSALLTNKWGWMTKIPVSEAGWGSTAVQFIGNDPTTGNFYIQCPALSQTPGIGQTIQLQGFQMTNRSYLNPNGTWQIANTAVAAGITTYTLRNSTNINSSFVFITGTARPIGYQFTQYSKCLLGAIASRRRGGSSLAPRGKRKSVVRVPA